jgi:hypothetical protein
MSRRGWGMVSVVAAAIAAALGLLFVGYLIMMAIALNSWGSNK